MHPRVTTAFLVAALIRRVQADGGSAAVLAKGDADAGALMLAIASRGRITGLLERVVALDTGAYRWSDIAGDGLDAPGALGERIERLRRRDPDLWVVELDSPNARAIADELLSG